MSFEVLNLPEVIKQAVQYGDLSPTESVVKNPDEFKAYAFIGANKGQVYCVFVAKQLANHIERLFAKSYEALLKVRASVGRNTNAQSDLASAEEEFLKYVDMLPIIELGATKTHGEFGELPMFYSF